MHMITLYVSLEAVIDVLPCLRSPHTCFMSMQHGQTTYQQLRKLRIFESARLGSSPWNYNFHPLRFRICLSQSSDIPDSLFVHWPYTLFLPPPVLVRPPARLARRRFHLAMLRQGGCVTMASDLGALGLSAVGSRPTAGCQAAWQPGCLPWLPYLLAASTSHLAS